MSEPPELCANCRQPLVGRYCAHCGEKRVEPDDHSLRRIIGHMFAAFTHADGKIFLTLRYLLTRPGRLTADYLSGRRKAYIPPLEVFLICNLVFFLLHPWIGSDMLTTDLNTHLQHSWHNSIAQALVTSRLSARHLTVDAYAAQFDPAAVTQAKSFVILVVPIFSLAVLALYWRHRRLYAASLIFSLHLCSFWLLQICAVLALTNLAVRLLRCVSMFPSAVGVRWGIILTSLVILTLYLYRAARVAFHREPVWVSVAKALTLAVALDVSLQAYRFALFFITFWTT